MDQDSLFQVAVQADCQTTETLLETYPSLNENNFWKRKFNERYPNVAYHEWWTAKENCQLQEHKMEVCIAFTYKGNVDCVLYKKDPIRERLLSLNCDICTCDNYYEFVEVDLSLEGEYALFEVEYDELALRMHIDSFSTEVEAKEFANSRRKEYEMRDFVFIVIKLSDLVLEFSLEGQVEERKVTYRISNCYKDDLIWR